MIAGSAIFCVLTLFYLFGSSGTGVDLWSAEVFSKITEFAIVAITIVVVAVPEGTLSRNVFS